MTHTAKTIMIQGTTSNAGKSFLTAALCRIFRQDGYRAAPFKSQNMALNSYITKSGLEMGRAQVMQAEAAGIEPAVEMNPILLKPTSHTGSQVIVNGEVLGNMSAADYYAYKPKLIPQVEKAFQKLSGEYDIIVIEGAGSPAEINLKDNDIVNMGMAKLAKAPVLLAGDIDRGGVFASLYGTVKLLEEEEQQRIKGLIVNKFRGDVEILRPGLRMIEEKTGIPVVGVVPMTPLDLDDEDSLSERLSRREAQGAVDMAVIHLPHISNFTDFNVFEGMEGISLRYVKQAKDLGQPDLIFLPGTKNTMGDLLWLRESGLEAAILRQAEQHTPIVGICGGYQMLGESIEDPEGIEQKGSVRGLGLLPMKTTFVPEKTRTRVKGHFQKIRGLLGGLEQVEIEGYEIHMGVSETREEKMLWLRDAAAQGAPKEDGLCTDHVYGCYVHGIFDRAEVVEEVVGALLRQKGYCGEAVKAVDLSEYKEEQYDRLAGIIRENVDMDAVYRILNADGEK